MARGTSHGEDGLDIQHGTKYFRAGTLLWLPPARWDPGHCRWHAVGRHQGNSRLRRVKAAIQRLDNWAGAPAWPPSHEHSPE
ncbi:hypothetical protein AB0K74_31365 [Streptomyces sp. NPDC056159]|uniref:hypothetical protein n=1 Tax=Streptomyces sp. NPDC056159 TaxID=3155537 RepID=UPI0034246C94